MEHLAEGIIMSTENNLLSISSTISKYQGIVFQSVNKFFLIYYFFVLKTVQMIATIFFGKFSNKLLFQPTLRIFSDQPTLRIFLIYYLIVTGTLHILF